MARIAAKAATVFVDEFDFSGVSNTVDIDVSNNLSDVTAFADTDETFVEGKATFTIAVNGFFSTASPNYDGEMFTDLTAADRRVGIYPAGTANGNRGYEGACNISAVPRIAERAGAALVNVTWQGDTPIIRSWMLYGAGAISGSGTGTGYQAGAVDATHQMVGILRVLSIAQNGNNTLDVIIQSDDASNFPSPTTQLTFDQINQGTGATFQVKTDTGTATDTWWRISYTYAGAGTTTFTIVVTFGIRPRAG